MKRDKRFLLRQKGYAVAGVLVIAIVFSILGIGVMLYAHSSTSLIYEEMKKMKAYYAAEAGLRRAMFVARNAGLAPGTHTFSWQLANVAYPIPISYEIVIDASGVPTNVTSTVPSLENIRLEE